MKGKFFLFIILLSAGTAAVSYFYSRDIYSFWLKAYYVHYKKCTREQMIEEAYRVMKLKDPAALKEYTNKLVLVYPDSDQARLMNGIALLRSGETEQGLALIVSSIDGVKLPGALIDESVSALYKEKYYAEIVSIMQGRKSLNAETNYYYGRALYEMKSYVRAFAQLKIAHDQGQGGDDLYYYLAVCSDKSGKRGDALAFMKRAWELAPDVDRNAQGLIDLYRRAGMQEQAEKVVRKLKQ
ncbi:MAG TPA: hypothetical protein PK926_17090 [Spirochaetota bacterium]|nr:hypothetical protein [Spirochaetota bacterium]HPI90695.1 hypothetical protein [Spirochaetota bacterium]HPR49296.1 hypothetical protein [Spirochaetota bacterium]